MHSWQAVETCYQSSTYGQNTFTRVDPCPRAPENHLTTTVDGGLVGDVIWDPDAGWGMAVEPVLQFSDGAFVGLAETRSREQTMIVCSTRPGASNGPEGCTNPKGVFRLEWSVKQFRERMRRIGRLSDCAGGVVFIPFCYLVLRPVLQLAVWRLRSNDLKELEIVVLRHELAILRRRTRRPAMTWTDRLFLAAVSRLLPRARWRSFIITPGTLLR